MATAAPAERIRLHVPTAVAAALGLALLLETLRVWFPSVAFVYGRAGSTPPEQLGLFALGTFLVPFVAVPSIRRLGSRAVFRAAAYGLVGARVVAQASTGGDLQLWSTTVGAIVALILLAAAAGGALARPELTLGLVAGLAIDASFEILLTGGSLLWLNGPLGWLLLAPVLALLLASAHRAIPAQMVVGTAAAPWLLIGPLLAVHLVLAGGASRVVVPATSDRLVGGLSAPVLVGVLAGLVGGAYATGVRYGFEARASARWPWLLPAIVTGAVVVTTLTTGWAGAIVPVVLLVLALSLAGAVLTSARGSSTPARHAAAVAGGGLLLFLVAFPYYATYDLPLGFWNGWLLVAAGIGLGGGLWHALRRGSSVVRAHAPAPTTTGAAVLGIAVVLGTGAALGATVPEPAGGDGYPVRVALWNLHMGFDTEGRYVASEQAAFLAAQRPDVVVLNEVDRGWALNGGQDLLTAVADELGLPYVFTPAADDIWGNAILTRFPVLEVRTQPLPDSDGYMARSVLSLVLEIGTGRELVVVGTHLHHRGDDPDVRLPQARSVAELAAALAEGGRPVIVAGDLNAPPDAAELVPLTARFRLASPGRAPATYPSWDPDETIDHVLVTPDLRVTAFDVPRTTLSDHLPVVVEVTPVG